MDQAFEDIFGNYDLQELLEILGYGLRDAYLEAESTIEANGGRIFCVFENQCGMIGAVVSGVW